MEIYISGNDEFGNVTWKMTNSEIEIEKADTKFGVHGLSRCRSYTSYTSCTPYFYKNRKIDMLQFN